MLQSAYEQQTAETPKFCVKTEGNSKNQLKKHNGSPMLYSTVANIRSTLTARITASVIRTLLCDQDLCILAGLAMIRAVSILDRS